MTALWIALAALALLAAAFGLAAFEFACVRRKQRDMTKPENLRNSHYAPIADEMLAGMALLDSLRPETLEMKSFDGLTLRAKLVTRPGSKGTLLLFHGYRSTYAIDFSVSAPFYLAQGYDLLLAEQRSHGASEGRYITFGVRERRDVCGWTALMAQRYGPDRPLFLGGLSMGASSVLMASGFELPGNVRGIVADCGFTSPYEIMSAVLRARRPHMAVKPALALMGLWTRAVGGFSLRGASTLEAVRKTRYPILFIHGTGDSFVPCRMSQEACDACRSEKRLVLVEGADHAMSYLRDRPRVQAALETFFEDHLKG